MFILRFVPLLLAAVPTVGSFSNGGQEDAGSGAALVPADAFPVSTALQEGLDPAALNRLGNLVQSFVDDGEVVGAELLVIKNGKSILHEGYGWRDREEQVAMEPGGVFCVRSMTKPLIGTAILMLAADKQLKLDDPLSRFLPSFSGDDHSKIRLEHLLAHTSGLPLSLIMASDLSEFDGVQAVAALGAEQPLEFKPGSAFSYSDQGADTLTAVIEAVTGAPASEFITARILEPLGMTESACILEAGHPLRDKGCAKYTGSRGNWNRFWGPSDPPIFPFFLGSQGLYSTLEDYARFMDLWMKRGRSDQGRLLRARSVRKALSPNPFVEDWGSGLPDAQSSYGYLMQLWSSNTEGSQGELTAFGHNGSDGTHAWGFPEQDAMVFYFTQSRGNTTGLRVEEALGQLLLGAPFDPNLLAPPFDDYLGYFSEDEFHRYQAVVIDGDDLALETPGKRIRPLVFAGGDSWKFRDRPGVVMTFKRSDSGSVSGFDLAGYEEFRFEPAEDLPTVAEVAVRIKETHRLDILESAGPIRLRGSLQISRLGVEGDVTSVLAWPDKSRLDVAARGNFEHAAVHGDDAWYESTTQKFAKLEGAQALEQREGHWLALMGDWSEWFDKLTVIQRIQRDGNDWVLVRAGDTSSVAATLYVDWRTGRLVRVERVALVEGMGRTGRRASFGDFRDVEGMLLPFETRIEMANPMIGEIVTTYEGLETGVTVPEGYFSLTEDSPASNETDSGASIR